MSRAVAPCVKWGDGFFSPTEPCTVKKLKTRITDPSLELSTLKWKWSWFSLDRYPAERCELLEGPVAAVAPEA